VNALLGLSVLSWAVLGARHTWLATGGITWVRGAATCIHLTAGVLFLTRRSMVIEPELRHAFVILPCFVAAGFAFKNAPPTDEWSALASALFVAGAAVVIVSLIRLGQNFDVIPAVRGITTSGPFGWIRHPSYFGELVIGLSCFLAARSWVVGLAIIALVPSMILRIHSEERLLRSSEKYRRYCEDVRWRLLPGVW